MKRNEIKHVFKVNDRGDDRFVTVKATDSVAVEDCYGVMLQAVLHRYKTGEDVVPTIQRDVKDAIIRVNLSI